MRTLILILSLISLSLNAKEIDCGSSEISELGEDIISWGVGTSSSDFNTACNEAVTNAIGDVIISKQKSDEKSFRNRHTCNIKKCQKDGKRGCIKKVNYTENTWDTTGTYSEFIPVNIPKGCFLHYFKDTFKKSYISSRNEYWCRAKVICFSDAEFETACGECRDKKGKKCKEQSERTPTLLFQIVKLL